MARPQRMQMGTAAASTFSRHRLYGLPIRPLRSSGSLYVVHRCLRSAYVGCLSLPTATGYSARVRAWGFPSYRGVRESGEVPDCGHAEVRRADHLS